MKYPGFTISELVVVLGVIALLLGLLLPVIHSVRQSARNTICKNNIRQIGVALELLRGAKRQLPEWDVEPETAGGWSVAVLPYVETGNSISFRAMASKRRA